MVEASQAFATGVHAAVLPFLLVCQVLSQSQGGVIFRNIRSEGIALSPRGNLYISDTEHHRVLCCRDHSSADCLDVAGVESTAGAQPKLLKQPRGIAVTLDGYLLVADTGNSRVQLWPPSLCEVDITSEPRAAITIVNSSKLREPAGLALDLINNDLYVADTGNNRIVRFHLSTNHTVVDDGLTVAGVIGVAGSNLTLLDNPTTVAIDDAKESFWVTDTGNRRLVRWAMNSQTGDANVAAEGVLEMSLDGHPYGLVFQPGKLYVLDHDGCTVWKQLRNDDETNSPVRAAGDSCGTSSRQLSEPTSLVLTSDNSIIVADTGNRRLVRFTSAPAQQDLLCMFDEPCSITLTDGQPSPANILAVVDSASSCGGPCTIAGLAGMAWRNIAQPTLPPLDMSTTTGPRWTVQTAENTIARTTTWTTTSSATRTLINGSTSSSRSSTSSSTTISSSSTSQLLTTSSTSSSTTLSSSSTSLTTHASTTTTSPQEELDFLLDSYFDFGIARVGVPGAWYTLCWGATSDVHRVEQGDCSLVSYEVGKLTMLSQVYSTDTSEKVCLNGQGADVLCSLQIDGYALPEECVLMVEDRGHLCGQPSPRFNTEVVTLNPRPALTDAETGEPRYEQPNAGDGDLTTHIWYRVGVAQAIGRLPLCICFPSSDGGCETPADFVFAAGFLSVKGPYPEQSFDCRRGQPCRIVVRGAFLEPSDRIIVRDAFAECWNHNGLPTTSVEFGVAQGADAVQTGEDAAISFNLGMANREGVYQVCYCPSYQLDPGNPDSCTVPQQEFYLLGTQLRISHVDMVEYVHDVNDDVTVEVTGEDLSSNDKVIVVSDINSCGNVTDSTNGNLTVINAALSDMASSHFQEFRLGRLAHSGLFLVCYCAFFGYDGNTGHCSSYIDFFQLAGHVVVRGPLVGKSNCDATKACSVRITGYELTDGDFVMVCGMDRVCGTEERCDTSQAGLLNPSRPVVEEGAVAVAHYALGRFAASAYQLCYCVSTSSTLQQQPSCSTPGDAGLVAGQLIVRGAYSMQQLYCFRSYMCQIGVDGFYVNAMDQLVLCAMGSTCGESISSVPGFELMPIQATALHIGENEGVSTVMFPIYAPSYLGYFKMCYCASSFIGDLSGEPCSRTDLTGSFSIDAGIFFTKGLSEHFNDLRLIPADGSETLLLSLTGVGFRRNTDMVQVIKAERECGGEHVGVEGAAVEAMNGVYRKNGTLHQDRPVYVHVSHTGWIIYYSGEGWEIGPGTRTGAFHVSADGAEAAAPTEVPGPWRNSMSSASTEIVVRGNAALQQLFSTNPILTETGAVDDVLDEPFSKDAAIRLVAPATHGAWRLCLCMSLDGADSDNAPCTTDDEFTEAIGMLVVSKFDATHRQYCREGYDCEVRTRLSADAAIMEEAVGIMIAARGTECHHFASDEPPAAVAFVHGSWGNLTAASVEAQFTLPSSLGLHGTYQLCGCVASAAMSFDCSKSTDYFQQAGVLSLTPEIHRQVVPGTSFIVNFSSDGLRSEDRLLLRAGTSCGPTAESVTARADILPESSGLSWVEFLVSATDADGGPLAPGSYAICLCTQYDGSDSNDEVCSNAGEFSSLLGKVAVSGILGERQYSSATSSINITMDTSRRLTAGMATPVRDPSVVSALANLISATAATVLDLETSQVYAEVLMIRELAPELIVEFALQVASDSLEEHLSAICLPWLSELRWLTDAQREDCLLVVEVLQGSGTALADAFVFAFSAVVSELSVYLEGTSLTLSGVGPAESLVAGIAPIQRSCAAGVPCLLDVSAVTPPSTDDEVLIINGSVACGETREVAAEDPPSLRTSSAFIPNPRRVSFYESLAGVPVLDMGIASRPGIFTLCYCFGQQGSDTCMENGGFFQTLGVLNVRGPTYNAAAYPCLSQAPCTVLMQGVGLSYFDQVLVLDLGTDCSSGTGTKAAGFGVNPGSVRVESSLSSTEVEFDFGVITAHGTYQLCYCVFSTEEPAPCSETIHFGSAAGVLAIRGAELASVVCMGSDSRLEGCEHQLKGIALQPGRDRLMLVSSENSCGAAYAGQESPDQSISPNPIELQAAASLTSWLAGADGSSYADAVKWEVEFAYHAGAYRICLCLATDEESCSGSSLVDYFHDVGTLTIIGPRTGQNLTCLQGQDCALGIDGVQLTNGDAIHLIDVALWPVLSCAILPAEREPWNVTAIEVDAAGGHATFQAGVIPGSGASQLFRICYCASASSGECKEDEDFAITAGFVQLVNCPSIDKKEYSPAVEDVRSDDDHVPHVRLYVAEDQPDCSLLEGLSLQSESSFGTGVRVSASSRCRSNDLFLPAPRTMHISGTAKLTLHLRADGSTEDWVVELPACPVLEVLPAVEDTFNISYACPAMQVNILPLACTRDLAFHYALLWHLGFVLVAVMAFCEGHIGDFRRWLHTEVVMDFFGFDNLTALEDPHDGKVKSIGNPIIDTPLMQLLTWDTFTVAVVSGRLLPVFAHVAFVFFSRDMRIDDWYTMAVIPAACGGMEFVLQMVLVQWNPGSRLQGVPVEHPTSERWPVLRTGVAILKVHLDIILPSVAIAVHCEVWRMVAWAVAGFLFMQVALPSAVLLLSLLPQRREVDETAVPKTMRALRLPSDTKHLQAALIAGKVPIPQRDMARHLRKASISSVDFSLGVHPTFSAAASEKRRAARLRCVDRCCGILAVRYWVYDQLTGFQRSASAALKALLADFHVFFWAGSFASSHPEEARRQRLSDVVYFLESTGWHLAGSSVFAQARDVVDTDLALRSRRRNVCALFLGGFDATIVHALLFIVYYKALSLQQRIAVGTAVVLGVFQASQYALRAACGTLFANYAPGCWSFVVTGFGWFCLRLAAASGMMTACPGAYRPFMVSACTPAVIEYPALWLWAVLSGFMASEASERAAPTEQRSRHSLQALARLLSWPVWAAQEMSDLVQDITQLCYRRKRETQVNPVVLQDAAVLQAQRQAAARAREDQWLMQRRQEAVPLITAVREMWEVLSAAERQLPVEEARKAASPQKILAALVQKFRKQKSLGGLAGIGSEAMDGLRKATHLLRFIQVYLEQAGAFSGLEDEVEGLQSCLQILCDAHEAVRLRLGSGYNASFLNLKAIACEEIDHIFRLARALEISRSRHFRLGTMNNRAWLMRESAPRSITWRLIHWRILVKLRCLPQPCDENNTMLFSDAWNRHGTNAVVIAVICRWQPRDEEYEIDPSGSTALQLTHFANWYQRRWGAHLEPFFWIRACCLPRPANSWKDVAELRGHYVGHERGGMEDDHAFPDLETARHRREDTVLARKAAQATTADLDGYLPLVYAASDAVLICDHRGILRHPWVRMEMNLACAFAPSGSHMYATDYHLGRASRRELELEMNAGRQEEVTMDGVREFSRDFDKSECGQDEQLELDDPAVQPETPSGGVASEGKPATADGDRYHGDLRGLGSAPSSASGGFGPPKTPPFRQVLESVLAEPPELPRLVQDTQSVMRPETPEFGEEVKEVKEQPEMQTFDPYGWHRLHQSQEHGRPIRDESEANAGLDGPALAARELYMEEWPILDPTAWDDLDMYSLDNRECARLRRLYRACTVLRREWIWGRSVPSRLSPGVSTARLAFILPEPEWRVQRQRRQKKWGLLPTLPSNFVAHTGEEDKGTSSSGQTMTVPGEILAMLSPRRKLDDDDDATSEPAHAVADEKKVPWRKRRLMGPAKPPLMDADNMSFVYSAARRERFLEYTSDIYIQTGIAFFGRKPVEDDPRPEELQGVHVAWARK